MDVQRIVAFGLEVEWLANWAPVVQYAPLMTRFLDRCSIDLPPGVEMRMWARLLVMMSPS